MDAIEKLKWEMHLQATSPLTYESIYSKLSELEKDMFLEEYRRESIQHYWETMEFE